MPEPELVDHVARTAGLSPAEAARVIEDVTAYYRETVDDFVRRRHRDLQVRGRRNADIYATVAAELSTRLFAAPILTERQLRRLIYT